MNNDTNVCDGSSSDMTTYVLILQIVNIIATSLTGLASAVRFRSKCMGSEISIDPVKSSDTDQTNQTNQTNQTDQTNNGNIEVDLREITADVPKIYLSPQYKNDNVYVIKTPLYSPADKSPRYSKSPRNKQHNQRKFRKHKRTQHKKDIESQCYSE